jgi:chemotaxis protein methyltransferase CheR
MLFHRHALAQGMIGQVGRVLVTGTDVDAEVVRRAGHPAYGASDVAEAPVDLRQRYLAEEEGAIQPTFGIRRLVRFARHDLLADPYPAAPQHVIICRNVLIYFERSVQQQVIGRLRDALAPGGFLILGKVESLLGVSGFQRVAPRERIFRKVS